MSPKDIEKVVQELEKNLRDLNDILIEQKSHAFIEVRCKRLDVLHRKKDVLLSFQLGV